jgi:transcriptional regulator with XRE-family HTH domain
MGQEIARARDDAGISQRGLARAAEISQAHLSAIEAGSVDASPGAMARIAAALGGRMVVRLERGTGPIVRDHIQATMLQGLIRELHARWRRFLDVPVYRPVRGAIDLVLDDPQEPITIAGEAQSQLRRIEQQIRWATMKADALQEGGARELGAVLGARSNVSRLLLLRVTTANLQLARTYGDLLAAAYPARHADAIAALTGAQAWPGAALVWLDVTNSVGRLRRIPPRGITLGR